MCPACGHKFAGATHSPDGKGCDVVVERQLETVPVQAVKERCGCSVDPRDHGFTAGGAPK